MSALHMRYRQLARDSRQENEYSFATLLWLFIAGSLLGFVSEGVFHLVRKGSWAYRVGTIWGPFCVLYGFGAVLMYLAALAIRDKKPLTQFALFALTGSAVELAAGIFQKAVFGTVSWDYSAHALNLGGYVSLRMTLLWGIAGMGLMYVILPVLFLLFNRMHLGQRRGLCRFAAVFMCLNLLATSAVLMRWHERVGTAAPPSNAIEAWMDHRWPDEKLRERFPNMAFVRAEE